MRSNEASRRRVMLKIAVGAAAAIDFSVRAKTGINLAVPETRLSKNDAMYKIAELERRYGGTVGVHAIDIVSGRSISYRENDRFPMCSTHKLLSAAAVLKLVDMGRIELDKKIKYNQSDLLEYAPVTRKNVSAGSMALGDLCQAAIAWSDNTAANLLLKEIGGPQAWTSFARILDDKFSRVGRTEPELNSAEPCDMRDTSSPRSMTSNMNKLLLENYLSNSSRKKLGDWLYNSPVTANLLRAGLPEDWLVGDKSGAGDNGTRNDIGIAWRENQSPVLIAVYYTQSTSSPADRDNLIAQTGRLIADKFIDNR